MTPSATILALTVACAGVFLPIRPGAAAPLVTFQAETAGSTPFIRMVKIHLDDANLLSYVQFTIAPKPGSVTRAISARYSKAYLNRRAFIDAATGVVTVPVFGLYQNFTNQVDLVFGFVDGTTQISTRKIVSGTFDGGIYNHPTIVQARTADTSLSYDFIMLKAFSSKYSPVIIDTDGEVRWVGTDGTPSMQAIFYRNSFFVVASNGTAIRRMEFDGAVSDVADYASLGVTSFHHNFDFGKTGILTDVNTADYLESENIEVDTTGKVLHTWNLADIITDAMIAGGDDPTKFVAAVGTQYDWFHNNSAAYRPSDDSLIISSRENFVLALDYETGAIKWILGDPTKQWHEFPSLRKYALTATPGSLYPIGQHAVNIYQDTLLLFDNGYFSADHHPQGVNRTYSSPRKYAIGQAADSAAEIWNYPDGELIDSPICGSTYEDLPNNYLIDYATAGPNLYAEIIGLAPGSVKIFDYRFKELDTLATAWNAVVLHMENLVFD